MKANRVLAVGVALTLSALLAGCDSPMQSTDISEGSKVSPTVIAPKVQILKIAGSDNRNPDSVSMLCVDDKAFLYVYAASTKAGGPAMARFPEADESICGSEPR